MSSHLGRGVVLATLACGLLASHGPSRRTADSGRRPDPVVQSAPDPVRGVPLRIAIEGPSAVTSNELDLRVIVERRAPAAFRLQLRLPPAVELVDGRADEPINGGERRLERTFRVRLLDGIPSQSLSVVALARGRAQGVRAAAEYRFGRPEPALERPERPGPRLRVQGHDLGSAIPLR